VALPTAIQHPDVVRKLVVVSASFKRSGSYPEILDAMSRMGPEVARAMQQRPMYGLHAKIAPNPENWPVLIDKLGELLKRDNDWSNDTRTIKAPTMLVFADADSVRTARIMEFSPHSAEAGGTLVGTVLGDPPPN
jgi:pimeloyl-ACP methyl ester carboxylesterase